MRKIIVLMVILCAVTLTFPAKTLIMSMGSAKVGYNVGNVDSINFMSTDTFFNNGNIGGVSGVNTPPTDSTRFTTTAAKYVTYMSTYHYYNGGHLPGTISLRHSDGTIYGPFQTTGVLGQGGVANATWVCNPNVVIKAGAYVIIDSDPSTWSHNTQSLNRGFALVLGK